MNDQNNAIPAAVVSTAPAHKPEAHHEEITYNPKAPEPQIINGVKIYPTSYIPVKAHLQTPRIKMTEMQEWHIEAIHVVIFFALTIVLFIGMWKRPNLR